MEQIGGVNNFSDLLLTLDPDTTPIPEPEITIKYEILDRFDQATTKIEGQDESESSVISKGIKLVQTPCTLDIHKYDTNIKTEVQQDPLFLPLVLVERLRTSKSKTAHRKKSLKTDFNKPSSKIFKPKRETETLLENNSCVLCGNLPDKRTLNEQKNLQTIHKNDRAKALCKLLDLSDTRFVNFLQKSQYCKVCCQLIHSIVGKYVILQRIEKEICEYKDQVKCLLRTHYENILSAKEESQNEQEDMFKMLLDEIGYLQTRSRRSCTKASSAKIKATSRILLEDDVGVISEMDYNIDDYGIDGNDLQDDHEQVVTDYDPMDEDDDYNPEEEVEKDSEKEQAETQSDPDYKANHEPKEVDINHDLKNNKKSPTRFVRISENSRIKIFGIKCGRPRCNRTFATEDGKSRHIYVSHRNISKDGRSGILKCQKCEAKGIKSSFSDRKCLRAHYERHRILKDESWTCNICNKTLIEPRTIKKHKEFAHVTPNELDCRICALRLPNNEELISHGLLHKTETPFLCVLCQILTTSSVDLKRHMATNHPTAIGDGIPSTRHKCEVEGCDKTFASIMNRTVHMKRHREGDKDPPFKCPQCPLICSGNAELILHSSKHSTEALFQCDICGARLKYKKGLIRHRLRHEVLQTGGKFNYECKLCSKSFESTSSLRKHEEIHSGVPHLCDICGKSFTAKQGLDQHHRTHFKDKYPTYKRPNSKRNVTKVRNQEPINKFVAGSLKNVRL